jgi:ribosomal protein S18 acetylase RimI-like enzyme
MNDITISMNEVTLQPAGPADEEFLRRVYATTRADEMAIVPWTDEQKTAFVNMQFVAQHTFYHAEFPDARYDLVVKDGEPIGRIYVDVRPSDIRILDITLLPEYRGQGIGTDLIKAVMDEGARAGKTVSLHVEGFNRAKSLYDRLGYSEVQVDGIYILMEWKQETNKDRR